MISLDDIIRDVQKVFKNNLRLKPKSYKNTVRFILIYLHIYAYLSRDYKN